MFLERMRIYLFLFSSIITTLNCSNNENIDINSIPSLQRVLTDDGALLVDNPGFAFFYNAVIEADPNEINSWKEDLATYYYSRGKEYKLTLEDQMMYHQGTCTNACKMVCREMFINKEISQDSCCKLENFGLTTNYYDFIKKYNNLTVRGENLPYESMNLGDASREALHELQRLNPEIIKDAIKHLSSQINKLTIVPQNNTVDIKYDALTNSSNKYDSSSNNSSSPTLGGILPEHTTFNEHTDMIISENINNNKPIINFKTIKDVLVVNGWQFPTEGREYECIDNTNFDRCSIILDIAKSRVFSSGIFQGYYLRIETKVKNKKINSYEEPTIETIDVKKGNDRRFVSTNISLHEVNNCNGYNVPMDAKLRAFRSFENKNPVKIHISPEALNSSHNYSVFTDIYVLAQKSKMRKMLYGAYPSPCISRNDDNGCIDKNTVMDVNDTISR